MKTIKLIFALLFVTAFFSCKKEMTETNDPNIDDRTVNITLDGSAANINALKDLDGDGTNDFNLYISHPGAILTNSQVGVNGTGNIEFIAALIGSAGDIITTFNSGVSINSAAGIWKSLASFYFFDASVSATKFGFSDVGDKLVAFRTTDGADYFYGWMKVNITGGNKITIKEFGVQTVANTAIKVGAK